MNTTNGIVIWNNGFGFWFIPYADIDSYLKQVKQKPGAPAAPVPVTIRNPS